MKESEKFREPLWKLLELRLITAQVRKPLGAHPTKAACIEIDHISGWYALWGHPTKAASGIITLQMGMPLGGTLVRAARIGADQSSGGYAPWGDTFESRSNRD